MLLLNECLRAIQGCKMAKDFLGNDIQVGDQVIYAQLHYRSLKIGTITKITPKMVFIQTDTDKNYDWTIIKQFHDQVIKHYPKDH